MRRSILIATLFGLTLSGVRPCAPQSAGSADRNTPEALQAAYHQAMKAKDWAAAVAAAQRLVDLRASVENLLLLADAQVSSGANADGLTTSDRALDAAEKDRPAEGQPDAAWKDEKSKIYLTRGNAYLRLRRNPEALDAYNQAAALASNPSVAVFNICATYANAGDTQNAEPACRRAVQVDPNRANAWFVLAALLFGEAKLDAKGNFAITEECRQALRKYLELAPDGPHAADVKAMLQMAGQ